MRKERIGALFLLIVAVYAFIRSLGLPMGTWRMPDSGVFPLIISSLLIIVAGRLFITSKGKVTIDWKETLRGWVIPFKIVLLTTFFILALERLGYVVTASLYLFGLLLWVCHYRWWFAALFTALAVPATWFFFGKILRLLLPPGPWGT